MSSKAGIYAIGDLQGCLPSLEALLDKSSINLDQDQLWFAGDLINRGPQSLETLRFVKSLSAQMGDRFKTVLGNHDLHLLAMAHGVKKTNSPHCLEKILAAKDHIDLIEWLRHQPLLHRDKRSKAVLVHAGIYPHWSIKQAAGYAQEVEKTLQGSKPKKLLNKMYGKRPVKWSDDLTSWPRYRFIINAMTRMRYCTRKGALNFTYTGAPGTQGRTLYPWYQLHHTPRKNWRIVFGHWSTAGAWFDGNHIALDSGCLWGGQMTMARLDQRQITFTQVNCS
ncbi:MAG: symmetrical bis(5'-nucleosyl)-tetraphosphatase [Arenicellales bacterium]